MPGRSGESSFRARRGILSNWLEAALSLSLSGRAGTTAATVKGHLELERERQVTRCRFVAADGSVERHSARDHYSVMLVSRHYKNIAPLLTGKAPARDGRGLFSFEGALMATGNAVAMSNDPPRSELPLADRRQELATLGGVRFPGPTTYCGGGVE